MTPPTACREAIRRLWDFLDDDLSPEEYRAVEEHLSFCLRCCGELEFSREVRRMLDRSADPAIPGDVQARLERLLDDVLPDVPVTVAPPRFGTPRNDPHGRDTGAIT
jgi:anti-sigma factor (TIGR02949 family)